MTVVVFLPAASAMGEVGCHKLVGGRMNVNRRNRRTASEPGKVREVVVAQVA
jgi:hypothetical protein